MRILQLVSDWKWTGPAQPMLVLSRALRERGHVVDLVCPETPPGATRSLWREAEQRGLAPVETIEPLRSAVLPGDAARARRLRGWLETPIVGGPYDVVQCWHSRDHVLAARALGLARPGPPRTRRRTRLVRFDASGAARRGWPWNRWLFGPACDGLVCCSEASVGANAGLRGGRPIGATTGAVELAAVAPLAVDVRARLRARLRASLGLPADALLIGVVARMQAHRRFDLLLAALGRLARREPRLHLVVIGRGTHADRVVREPARAAGLAQRVVLAGYRTEDYAEVLAGVDWMTFLVPGSDGTCRALLEGAALGLPLVGTRRGAIPEIVSNGQTGLLVDETPESLAAAWQALLADPERRLAMGRAAARDARARFAPDRFAARMERFYEQVLGDGRAASTGSDPSTRGPRPPVRTGGPTRGVRRLGPDDAGGIPPAQASPTPVMPTRSR